MLEGDGELVVTMEDKYDNGDWGQGDICETGTYGSGIQLEVRYM